MCEDSDFVLIDEDSGLVNYVCEGPLGQPMKSKWNNFLTPHH